MCNLVRLGLYGLRQLRTGDRKPELAGDMAGECGEAVAQVPDEGMTTDNDIRRTSTLEAPHGAQTLLQMAMIALNTIVQVA